MSGGYGHRFANALGPSALIAAVATAIPATTTWRSARGALERVSPESDPQEAVTQTKRGAQMGALAGFLLGTVALTFMAA